jgi:hypothetical protein
MYRLQQKMDFYCFVIQELNEQLWCSALPLLHVVLQKSETSSVSSGKTLLLIVYIAPTCSSNLRSEENRPNPLSDATVLMMS